MLLTLALALAHPDHGDPRSHAIAAAVHRDRFPPVPATYAGVLQDLRARHHTLKDATKAWKVADVVHECDTMVRFARALPVKVMDRPEPFRTKVDTGRTELLQQIAVLRAGIPTHDAAGMQEALAAIGVAIDGLPTVSSPTP